MTETYGRLAPDTRERMIHSTARELRELTLDRIGTENLRILRDTQRRIEDLNAYIDDEFDEGEALRIRELALGDLTI